MKLKKCLPYCTWKLHGKIFWVSRILQLVSGTSWAFRRENKHSEGNNSKIWETGKILVILLETFNVCECLLQPYDLCLRLRISKFCKVELSVSLFLYDFIFFNFIMPFLDRHIVNCYSQSFHFPKFSQS